VQHFLEEFIPKSTIYDILKRKENGLPYQQASGQGAKATKMPFFPFFVPSGLAINQSTYLDECIKKRLIPFIETHHSDGKYVCWHDLVSSRYAKTVIAYLREKKVNFVDKQDNPSNSLEPRPI
jgi:hypothetical protein